MRDVERVLVEQLPASWIVRAKPAQSGPIDLAIEVGSEPDRTVTLAVEIKRSIDPRQIPGAAMQIKALTDRTLPQAKPVVAAGYLSPRSRQLLEDFEVVRGLRWSVCVGERDDVTGPR